MRILGLTAAQLTELFKKRYGKGAYHALAAYTRIMGQGKTTVREVPNFLPAPALAKKVENDIVLDLPRIVEQKKTAGTTKLLYQLTDGLQIESVIIPMRSYATLCVSSQVGCRMGCAFCTTAKMGLKRNLRAEEIVGQVYQARFQLGHRIRNVVFMGMGEPLDNLEEVVQAIRVLSDQRGLNIPLSKITLSTAGRVDGLKQLGEYQLSPLRVAISLNACNDSLRSRLMPLNNRYPLTALKRSLQDYPLGTREIFFIEYILLRKINDSEDHAGQLVNFVQDLPVRVNLIPYNPGRNALFERPSDNEVQAFADQLRRAGIFVRIRWSKGSDIAAGCGQLGSEKSCNLKAETEPRSQEK